MTTNELTGPIPTESHHLRICDYCYRSEVEDIYKHGPSADLIPMHRDSEGLILCPQCVAEGRHLDDSED
jgi:hypothetical protein